MTTTCARFRTSVDFRAVACCPTPRQLRSSLPHYDASPRPGFNLESSVRKVTAPSQRVNSARSGIQRDGEVGRLIPVDILTIRTNPIKGGDQRETKMLRSISRQGLVLRLSFFLSLFFFPPGDRDSNRVKCTCTGANCQTAIAFAAGDESEDRSPSWSLA